MSCPRSYLAVTVLVTTMLLSPIVTTLMKFITIIHVCLMFCCAGDCGVSVYPGQYQWPWEPCRGPVLGHSTLWSLVWPSWKSAGKGICHSPALNNNTSQPCSCWCFKCYHWWEETMNFCLQIWLESSEWPHTKLFLALVITIEPWLPPRPELARIYWVMSFNNNKQQPQFKWLLSFREFLRLI